ncbi:MAG TPA: hypothetical protein VMU02_12525, partial [bacterium]|nr:hypothetical protein [bacterium]
MRSILAGVAAVVALVAGYASWAFATTVCDVQAYDPATGFSPLTGNTVTLTGLATVPTGVFQPTRTSIYIRGLGEDVCGINVYSTVRVGDIAVGDTVTVTGVIQEYVSSTGKGATTEITFSAGGDVLVKRGTTVAEPVVMATGEVGREINEGKFIRVTGKLVTGMLGRSFSVDDGTGTLEIFDLGQNFSSDPLWQSLRYGEEVTVTGVVSQSDADAPYLSGYSLVPRSPALGDVQPVQCIPGGSEKAVLHLSKNIFSPTDGEKIRITYNCPNGARLRLRIYDVCGRCVANLDDRTSLCGETEFLWDGRDEVMQQLPSGV